MTNLKLKPTLIAAALAILSGGAFPALAVDDGSQATYQAANMFVFGSPATLVPGAATLTRTNDGISFRIYTQGLAPGATTVWIIIFNNPENCVAGGPGVCMGPDLGNPAVEGSIVYGTGYNVGADGIGNFHGSLADGKPPAGISVNIPAGTANGLKNSKKAEVHFVVRSHGPAVAGQAVAQFSTFEAGCGACVDVQAVAFPVVE